MKINNFINKAIIVPFADRFMGTKIMPYYKMIKLMSEWSPEKITDWQYDCLKNLINHAYEHTKYYRELLQKSDIHPSDIKEIYDLQKLPILSKEIIIKNFRNIQPDNLRSIKYKNVATGGSTGDPLKYLLDSRSYSFSTAYRYFYMNKSGYCLGDKLAVIGGSSVYPGERFSKIHKIYQRINGKTFLDGVNMSDTIIDNHLRILNNKKIEYIFGYSAAIYLMAIHAKKTKTKLPHLKTCFTTSEMLLPEYRNQIKSAFNCDVVDVYGAGDGGITAYETDSNIYNVGYNSIIDVEGDGSENNTGNILVTDLFNYACPFINYRLGDQISLMEPEKAKNIYNGQIITKVWGRISDVIRLENGNILTGVGFATFLFSDLNIHAYRIKKIGTMHIECEIQKAENFTQDEEKLILKTLKKYAGEECKVTIKYLSEFEPLASGKRSYFFTGV